MNEAYWLPIIFVALMGLSIFLYAILDGYDLGVGITLPMDKLQEGDRDTMIASIGPFWDANETWLVLAVGLLLIAFPSAHSLILFHLYLPATFMLIGLIMRGVAFDFRAKAAINAKYFWDCLFKLGSTLTALAQGYMLGAYVTGFSDSSAALFFSVLSALGVCAAYAYIGSAWLVMRTSGDLQESSIRSAIVFGRVSFIGVIAVSLVNLYLNPSVFAKWFEFPLAMFVILIPLLCFSAYFVNDRLLMRFPFAKDQYCWLPFVLVIFIFLSCFLGLGFSYFPYIVPNQIDIWQAASAPESLRFILYGAVIVVPVILIYTVFAYRIFRGKAKDLQYY